MEFYQTELVTVKKILRENPRGMTILDISRKIKINRNSVAKYLDILLVSGHAEMVAFGPAKVFFPSRRVPISSILNYISDFIIVIDRDLRIVQVNENFLNLLNIERELVLGNSINDLLKIFLKFPELIPNIQNALNGKTSIAETRYKKDAEELYFKIKLIPTTLDNGEPGVGLIFKEITKQKIAEAKMQQTINEWNTTFNIISDMIAILDNNFNIIKINKAFADFFQINPAKIIGKKCYKVIHGTNKPDPNCPCNQTKILGGILTKEFFEPHLGKHIKVTVSPVIDKDGKISGSVNILKDITGEIKQDELSKEL